MKPPRKKFRLNLSRTGLVITIFVVLSVLLGIGIHLSIRIFERSNAGIVQKATNVCKDSSRSPIQPEIISLDRGAIKKIGSINAGQHVSYVFQAKTGATFNYRTEDNICVTVYTPDKQILKDKELLKEGQYLVSISTSSGSTTFDLEMNSKNPASQIELFTSPKIVNQNQSKKSSNTFLNHYAYKEVNQSQLILISSYAHDPYQRFEYFDREAGKALMKLVYAARDEGVWIVPVSGFRDLEKQKLLFEKQIEKKGSEAAAAKVSAPPGYSEHHTGYAIDLTDGQLPKQDITNEFAETKAYHWLTLHAKEFGFEMSFPKNNPEGVVFEPWHWRFIGNPDAMTTFANTRSVS
jgi:zinc D-Ala-D-Ala carboxypeptidase